MLYILYICALFHGNLFDIGLCVVKLLNCSLKIIKQSRYQSRYMQSMYYLPTHILKGFDADFGRHLTLERRCKPAPFLYYHQAGAAAKLRTTIWCALSSHGVVQVISLQVTSSKTATTVGRAFMKHLSFYPETCRWQSRQVDHVIGCFNKISYFHSHHEVITWRKEHFW